MLGKNHVFFAATTSALLYTSYNFGVTNPISLPFTLGTFVAGSAIGSLIVDMDSETSTLGRKLPFIPKLLNYIFDIFDKTKGIVKLKTGTCVFNHRRFLHDAIFVLPLLYILSLYNPIFYGVLYGAFTHLFLDSFTEMGIPFLYLFNKRKIHFPFIRVKSNSIWATFLTYFLTIIFPSIFIMILAYKFV